MKCKPEGRARKIYLKRERRYRNPGWFQMGSQWPELQVTVQDEPRCPGAASGSYLKLQAAKEAESLGDPTQSGRDKDAGTDPCLAQDALLPLGTPMKHGSLGREGVWTKQGSLQQTGRPAVVTGWCPSINHGSVLVSAVPSQSYPDSIPTMSQQDCKAFHVAVPYLQALS